MTASGVRQTEAVRPPSSEWGIEARGLTKLFGDCLAVSGLNLKVKQGESVVILGPNGAGKTTLIKLLATVMKPTSGEVFISGLSARNRAEEVRRRIGLVTHNTFLYCNLTVRENMKFYSRMYGIPESDRRVQEVLGLVDMTARFQDRVGTLSRGMQQRLSIARALLHQPAVMLLDEPETGLDQQALGMLWGVVKGEGKEKRTVVMTTHNLERGLALADRLVVLCRGKAVYQESARALAPDSLRLAYEKSTGVKV